MAAAEPVPLTREGFQKLREELERLSTAGRREIAERIAESREGLAVDSAEYEDAKDAQAHLERRISVLQDMLQNAVIIDETRGQSSGRILLGSRVRLRREKGADLSYTLVGPAEANPSEGKISHESPVGRALLGKRIGDTIEVVAPAGVVRMRVEAIE